MDEATLTHERKPLAEAPALRRAPGRSEVVWISARLGGSALAGDAADVARFRLVAERYEGLPARRPG